MKPIKTIQHTPGNWGKEYCGKDTIKIFKTSDSHRICTIKIKEGWRTMDEANARLIAAAPEMLEALEAIVRCWEEGNEVSDTTMAIVGLAVSKATI